MCHVYVLLGLPAWPVSSHPARKVLMLPSPITLYCQVFSPAMTFVFSVFEIWFHRGIALVQEEESLCGTPSPLLNIFRGWPLLANPSLLPPQLISGHKRELHVLKSPKQEPEPVLSPLLGHFTLLAPTQGPLLSSHKFS